MPWPQQYEKEKNGPLNWHNKALNNKQLEDDDDYFFEN